MIIKIWPVKADYAKEPGKASGVEGLKNAFEYITNAEKVIVKRDDTDKMQILNRENKAVEEKEDTSRMQVLDREDLEEWFENNEVNNSSRVFHYMANEDKIKGKYISGYLCDPDVALSQFDAARELTLARLNRPIKKETGAIAYHMVQSFPEELNISDEEVHQCGIELCKMLGVHQAVICSHVHPVVDDEGEVHGKCKHNHILFNAYIHPDKLDPKQPNIAKYHDCDQTYAQLRVWNDKIAFEHNLPIIRNPDDDRVYSYKETEEMNQGRSFKQRVRIDIEAMRRSSSGWADFVKQMEAAGYKVKEGAHVTYTLPGGKHKVRDYKLGRRYKKENLEIYWSYRDYSLQAIQEESKLNDSPTLLDVALATEQHLSAAIPIGMKSQTTDNYVYLPLENVTQSNETLRTYFNENELYDICDENKHVVLAQTGKEIIECLEQLRNGKEEFLNKNKEDSVEKDSGEQTKSEQKDSERYYTCYYFVSSRTRKRYRTSLYDNNGRRRSVLELMVMLAITVLNKEAGLWEPTKIPEEKKGDPIYAPRSWKIQNMLDTLTDVQEEKIETPAQLKQRLDEAGAACKRAGAALKKTTRAKEKMEVLNDAVKSYRRTSSIAQKIFAMPEDGEKKQALAEYKEIIDRYNEAKAVLYQYGVKTEEEIADFENRYKKIKKDITELEERLELTNTEYRRLKKMNYNIELAQNTQYCYGPNYSYDKLYGQEQERENDDSRNKREAQQLDKNSERVAENSTRRQETSYKEPSQK